MAEAADDPIRNIVPISREQAKLAAPKIRTRPKLQRRQRQRKATAGQTGPASTHVGLRAITFVAALGLAAVAAFFSISGMMTIFPGAPAPVTAMAIAMESGKLIGAAWLAHEWRNTGATLRAAMVGLIAVLAIINATGVYGRLTAAHLGPHAAAMAAIEQQSSTVDARIEVQDQVIRDLDRRIAQIDAAVEETTRRGRTKSALALAEAKHKNRDALLVQHQREAAVLIGLKADQAQIAAATRHAEADVGPLRYAATLIGLEPEQALRLLILLMVLCCDPMAIVLVVAASARR